MSTAESFAENIERFTGFAGQYDRHRPGPPAILAELAAQYTGRPRPRRVVDLGSGTGLSTRYWGERADQVIGIEPTSDMRQQAVASTAAPNVSYRTGFSHQTGLPEETADVICCMQALHWMEPAGTFAEAKRLLVPGGVFLACDYDWPPATGSWQADQAFVQCAQKGRALEQQRQLGAGLRQWEKEGHLGRMGASGAFRFVREAVVHHEDRGNAERLVGLLLSQGYAAALLKAGVSEEEIGVTDLRRIAEEFLGERGRPWIWGARIRLGVV